MAGNNLTTPEARIGATKGAILKHAEFKEVLGITGTNHDMAKNTSDTVKFRRWLPTGATTTNANTINRWSINAITSQLQEGVTPNVDKVDCQDITVQLKQYGAIYYYTDWVEDLYEDDIPKAQKEILGQRMGGIREMIRYGALKGCTNKFYAGGTSRATVDGKISLDSLRIISRSLKGNSAEFITSVLGAGPGFNTAPVEAAFLVFVHTDAENDIRNLPGFREVAAYGQRKPVHAMEIGSADNYRFIISPNLASIPNAGASVTGTGLYSTGGSNVDVYPYIVVAKEAWGDVALRGGRSFDYKHLKPNQIDKSDILGQRGYCGAKFYSAMFVQNDGWMAVLEAGVTALSA
jgi:N4-gp56 family major capsid protein